MCGAGGRQWQVLKRTPLPGAGHWSRVPKRIMDILGVFVGSIYGHSVVATAGELAAVETTDRAPFWLGLRRWCTFRALALCILGVQASLLTWLGGTLPRKCWWAARGRSGLEVVRGNAEPVRRAIRPWGRLRCWCRGTSEKMLPRSSHRLDHFSDFLLGLPTGDTNGHP